MRQAATAKTLEQPDILDLYPFRPPVSFLYYLSPWEFVKLWTVETLGPPNSYAPVKEVLTQWTQAGTRWLAANATSRAEELVAGKHYCLKNNVASADIVPLPDLRATASWKYRCVFRRRVRPAVPRPAACPLPQHAASKERRLNVYLRPWVGVTVLLSRLNRFIGESTAPQRRVRQKTDLDERCTHAAAWEAM